MAIFLGQFCPRGKDAMMLTLYEAPTRETKPGYNTWTTCPTLCDKRVGSLTSPANHVTLKMWRRVLRFMTSRCQGLSPPLPICEGQALGIERGWFKSCLFYLISLKCQQINQKCKFIVQQNRLIRIYLTSGASLIINEFYRKFLNMLILISYEHKTGLILVIHIYIYPFLYSKINPEYSPHQKSIIHSVEMTSIIGVSEN